ncbi:hypothetical protein B0H67DRAFT_23482 [Lasiosphaeris hirsuta]|uniref:Uncharacterized protein n=1 Tax=Lasiosphaeris hirsuta TaxID=260670 RepID=A0AA40B9T7_9PEZI|nr:hypothetical protein B0H67DRAFT_23482 [Lasiosphaeris hirsuta]
MTNVTQPAMQPKRDLGPRAKCSGMATLGGNVAASCLLRFNVLIFEFPLVFFSSSKLHFPLSPGVIRSRSQCKPFLGLVLFLRLSATFWSCRSRKKAAGCRDRVDQFPKKHGNQVNNLDTTRDMRGASPRLGPALHLQLGSPAATPQLCLPSSTPRSRHADLPAIFTSYTPAIASAIGLTCSLDCGHTKRTNTCCRSRFPVGCARQPGSWGRTRTWDVAYPINSCRWPLVGEAARMASGLAGSELAAHYQHRRRPFFGRACARSKPR